MRITASTAEQGIVGVCGHAGAGHVHSNFGFVQDDSAGFAVAATLMNKAYPSATRITEVSVHGDDIEVRTEGGGTGRAAARRGVTPFEADIMQRAVGLDSIFSQGVAFASLGRIYGQGVLEVPVALQTAACLAAVDTFSKTHPDAVRTSDEDLPGNCGACMGAVLDMDGVPVSVLATLNATAGGLGPAEDLEGNIFLGNKGRLMRSLGLEGLPTIIIESKAYVPAMGGDLTENSLWVRYHHEADNLVVGEALAEAAKEGGHPFLASDTAYARSDDELRDGTRALGERIARMGRELAEATTAQSKVRIVAELAELVSQDAGGVTFMSDELHRVVAGGGLVPGLAAVLSMVMTRESIEHWNIPLLDAADAALYVDVITRAVPRIAADMQRAKTFGARRERFDTRLLESHLL